MKLPDRHSPQSSPTSEADPKASGLAAEGDACVLPHSPASWVQRIGDLVLSRQVAVPGSKETILVVSPATDRQPSEQTLERLTHEYSLRARIDSTWGVKPRALDGAGAKTVLLLDDPGGELLSHMVTGPWDIGALLRTAIGLALALSRLHANGLVHKDVRPEHLLVDVTSGRAWITGFGIASSLPRERQSPEPVSAILGSLPYMAPEQTGRMNRSVDGRSDLYSFGVTLYQLLTGRLPFHASEPLEWIHCHIARQPAPIQRTGVERLGSLPAIVLKLLSKTAEARYQSAAGVAADLRRCLHERELTGEISRFPLGLQDRPDRLHVPERLYGRDTEVAKLLESFDSVAAEGGSGLVFVSGYSGSGKSSLVNELHKALVPHRGLFASGKFDQYKRDIPYDTFAQAFQTLLRDILSKSEEEVAGWRASLRAALGTDGQLMVNLVPELEIVIGRQLEVPEWPAAEAAARFQTVFRAFLGVFARQQHPLVLFIDDLQWLDAASLTLLEHLATSPELHHVLLVGAYRDNEVTVAHPLARTLDAIRAAGVGFDELALTPLLTQDVTCLVADALQTSGPVAEPLARLLHEKGEGNPFFIVQFFTGLSDEGLLTFDATLQQWQWNVETIRGKGFTSNVVELMLGKLGRLPTSTQDALRLFSCVGSRAEVDTLATLHNTDERSIHEALRDAVHAGLVSAAGTGYEFVHDRVREAAYALLAEPQRPREHLRIGRTLLEKGSADALDEAIFEIVNQFNLALDLIEDMSERQRVAELNLVAGRRARASSAYTSACAYFGAGVRLLASDGWERCRDLSYELEHDLGECEFMTGDLLGADVRLSALSQRTTTRAERASLTWLQVTLCTALDQSPRAVEIGLHFLRELGIQWSPQPSGEAVQEEYDLLLGQVGTRTIDELVDLPLMRDPEHRTALDVLMSVLPPAIYTNKNLVLLVLCRAANISVEHGNSDASTVGYAYLGMYLGPAFEDYQAGYRFARLGHELVERRGLGRYKARVYMTLGYHVMPWTQPIDDGTYTLLKRTLYAATEVGDVNYVAYYWYCMAATHLVRGRDLAEAQRDAEAGLATVTRNKFGLLISILSAQLALVKSLRGGTVSLGCLTDDLFDESRFETHVRQNKSLEIAEVMYWIRKVEARYLAGDYEAALAAAAHVQDRVHMTDGHLEIAEFHFYAALSIAATLAPIAKDQGSRACQKLLEYHRQLQVWAENCPANWAARGSLVAAEVARVEGRELEAMRLYEQAIESAIAHGFPNNEAIAHEAAARFYGARGFDTSSKAHLRKARDAYMRWGAEAKVRQIEGSLPEFAASSSMGDVLPVGQLHELDFASVLKSSQAVSAQTDLERLMETLMVIVLQHAGAQRGLLIVRQGDSLHVEAQARVGADGVSVQVGSAPLNATDVAESVLRYVLRTQEAVLLADAAQPNPYSSDPYISGNKSRSVLCLPLVKQGGLIGVVYLENRLSPHVFTPTRIAVLKVLASQAAISLQNARLYAELQRENHERRQSEAALRRSEERFALAVDAAGDGHTDWIAATGEFYASPRLLDMCGLPADSAFAGDTEWLSRIPLHPDDRGRIYQAIQTHFSGPETRLELDLRIIRHGQVRWLHATLLCSRDDMGAVSRVNTAVTDITERTRAEHGLRSAQSELARVSRLTTVGQLAVSIAHEINQPLAAIVANAGAGANFLNRTTPDLSEAQQTFGQILQDGRRAADVIRSLLSLSRRSEPRLGPVDINEAAREVFVLLHSELERNRIALRPTLLPGDAFVVADRVQVQQVLINLMVNAMEAMVDCRPEERVLSLSTRRTESAILVSISDTGPGVSADVSGRIFEPFFTTKETGTGIGLSICRTIVEFHGSQLSMVQTVGRGATFEFELPLYDVDNTARMASSMLPS